MTARAEHLTPGEPRVLSKKEEWLREKALRPDVHVSDADLARWSTPSRAARARRLASRGSAPQSDPVLWPGERIEPVTTLFNIWTHEALPILPGEGHGIDGRFRSFLRDHFTNQATHMDVRLIDVLKRVAGKFSARRIEVVSGYRSPKYNLMLRKKGHQVARHSQHMEGHAVDFRIRGVATQPGAPLRPLAAHGRRRLLPALAVRPQRHGAGPVLDRVVSVVASTLDSLG